MHILKLLQKKKFKLFLKIKEKNVIRCKKLTSKIFYNLTYIYIKNNFLLINKLLKYNSFSNVISKNSYILNDLNISNDLFIINYLDNSFNNQAKTMININKTKKPLPVILILKKILFSNKNFFRLLKNEKNFLKINIYNIYFFLFYYYMINSLSYISFLKFNNLKKKKNFFTLNLFLKKNLKKSFKFFFKNIIMFLYKFSLIKHKKKKFFTLFTKRPKTLFKKFHLIFLNRKKQLRALKKLKIISFNKKKLKLKKKLKSDRLFYYKFMKLKRQNKRKLLIQHQKERKKRRKLKIRKRNIQFERKRIMRYKRKKYELYKKFILTKNLRHKLEQEIKIIKKENKSLLKKKKKIKLLRKNEQHLKLIKNKTKQLHLIETKLSTKLNKKFKQKLLKHFKNSLKKNTRSTIYNFKKLFLKKTLVKRVFELSFKKDLQLKNATSILKNNKKFKFLTFPLNSICKFFFKNSMYNIFMTLVVLPNNLTIGNYSGGHFNILSKRRDRGSINSLKSMAKLISLKIYQSNLSFIIFCPRLFTNNNKRLIKTIFHSFKILNRSPITKIYLYRPVIRNGIRAKKIPRK
jgi:hypothetical protein